MASYQPLQSSFAYGEISPRLTGRSNTDRYRSSLRTCENCFTFSHGNAVKRRGTQFIAKSPSEGNLRLFPLQEDITTPYIIELGYRQSTGGYVRVLDEDGYVSQGQQFVENPSFNDELVGWTDASEMQASVTWYPPGWVRFEPAQQGGGRTAILQQEVTVTSSAALHRVTTITFSNAPADAFVLNIGTTAGASDIASFSLINDGESLNTFTPGVATFWLSIEAAWQGAAYDNFLELCAVQDDSNVLFEAATPYNEEEIEKLDWDTSTGGLALYFTVQSQAPHRIIQDPSSQLWTWEPTPFSTAPSEFAPGNYPGSVTFHQQRLWFASTPNEPDTLWASQPLDFDNFDLGTGLPTESIKFELAGEGSIVWIAGARDLLVGLDRSEYILTSDGIALAPGDIQARQQSSYGGARHTPPGIGNGVLYLGNDRRRIRFQNYQFLEDGWVSIDITWPSEHITRPLVQELHFLYAPDPVIWLVMRDGTLVTAVYEREQDNLVGWHRQNFVNGELLSGATVKLNADVEMWCAMKRTIADSDVYYIEKLSFVDIDRSIDEQVRVNVNVADLLPFADAATLQLVEYDAVEDEYFIQGLDYLEGQEVQVLVEGAVHQPYTVNLGRVTLQDRFDNRVGALAVVGIGFTGILRTLPLEGGNQGGTAQHLPKTRNRIFLRLLVSSLPVVNDVVTGARLPVTPMDTAEPLFTGDLQVANLGWDRTAEVEILMPLPRPYNVLSIFGDAEVNRL